ncbi:MAG: LuxR family transcriptional regulator [Mucilaginibacter sp.]|nr:LuxR family transcriptional regulator [Mucilaginibacter sp.]
MNTELNKTDPHAVFASLQAECKQWQEDQQNLENSDDLFKIRSANTWLAEAATHQVPKMLFDKFWYEGELCIMFADSNLGKSILAVQIANSINRGAPISPFQFEAEPQPVLYYDFELTSKQLEARYSHEFADHYIFRDDLYRGQLNDMELPEGFTNFNQYLNHALERSIVQTKAKVIVIDNITYLGTENEQAKDALPLMKHLKALKTKYDLSILVLAHTPKRDMAQAITRNDLQGSKMLMNFCDSSFAIGESQNDTSLRYLKQIKQRNTEQVYGPDKVCLFTITKPHNFLQYEFLAFGKEWDHLSKQREVLNDSLIERATELKMEGKSLREIAKDMGITHQKVDRLIKAASNRRLLPTM